MTWLARRAGVATLGVLILLGTASTALADEPRPGERELLQHVFSPCCYRETLDVHASPIADELRIEIHQRLSRGETPEAITADLVERYGEDVLTRPPRTATALALFAGAGALVALLVGLALRRARPRSEARPAPVELGLPPGEQRRLEDRLEDELATLD